MISITSLFVYRHSGRRLPILFWTRCIARYAGLLRPAALLLCACVACSWATAAAELASTALKAKDPHCANQKSLHFSLLCSWPGFSVAANSGSGKLSCRIPKKGQDLGSVVHQGRHMNAAVSQLQRTAICSRTEVGPSSSVLDLLWPTSIIMELEQEYPLSAFDADS